MKDQLKTLIPHTIAVLVFVLISLVYFSPMLDGKRLVQSDFKHFKAMSKEIVDHRAMFGDEPLWTNSMFGGMPAYQIAVKYPGDVLRAMERVYRLWLPHPVSFVFLYMIGFYILMMSLRINPWLAIGGAIAFAFSSYFFIIIESGHNTKAMAIAYMAPTLAGIIWAYRGKLLLGTALTGLFLALQIHANHVQITYYFGFLVLFVAFALLIDALKEKKLSYWLKTSALLVVMVMLAVLCNFANLYNTWEYGKFTTRGATELTILPDGRSNENIATKGLDREYVTQWSYGIGETLTFLIPNAKGGSTGLIGEGNSHLRQASAQFRKNVAQSNQYWGDQPFTSGPVYFGALVFYLFILGLVLLPGNLRWGLLATAVLTTMLSWGSNYMGLTDFFLDFVPGYDKFRAVTIILSITALAIPILAFMFANQAIKEPGWLESKRKPFLIATGAMLGIMLVLWITPESFMSFISAQELSMFGAQASEGGSQAAAVNAFLNDLEQVRISIFKADAMRSLGFVFAGAVLFYLLMRGIVSKYAVIGVLIGLVLIDGWMVNKRYLNNEKERGRYVQWEDKIEYELPYAPSRADMEIAGMEIRRKPEIEATLAQTEDLLRQMKKDLGVKKVALSQSEQGIAALSAVNFESNYRVLNLGNPFNDGRTPYFHKSIGGYHGAKLKRYQELIEFHLSPEIQAFGGVLQSQPNQFQVMMAFEDMKVMNMLNMRYVIYNPEAAPLTNPAAYGNAWFVNTVEVVANADEEIMKLREIEPLETALVDAKFADYFSGTTTFEIDSLAEVKLESYKPNELVYKIKSEHENFIVFSEIHYDAGWQAYLNGTPVSHVRANYVLRGMKVPAGENEVVFRFEPEAFGWSSNVATFSSLLMLLLVGFGFWRETKPEASQYEL